MTVTVVDAKKSTLGRAEVVGRNVLLKSRDKRTETCATKIHFLGWQVSSRIIRELYDVAIIGHFSASSATNPGTVWKRVGGRM